MNDFKDPFQKPFEDFPEFLGCCGTLALMFLKVWFRIMLVVGILYLMSTNFSLGVFALIITITAWIIIGDKYEKKT